MFRLHIDIPLGVDEETAIKESLALAEGLKEFLCAATPKIQYRLADDEDRTVRNYLIKDDEGHVATKKCVMEF